MRYLIIPFIFFFNIDYAQKNIVAFYFDRKEIGIFPKHLDLSDTSTFLLNDTARAEFDKKGNLVEYCFQSFDGMCDFWIYKKYKLYIAAHYKPGGECNKKTKVFFIDPTTFDKTYRKEKVLKPLRAGTWTYYNVDGTIKKYIYY